ncbi:MAG: prephenate dehydrogenase/arogenate dehydrogenase family protein [Methanomicrobiales archaeon]|nr:prephenate dehydrogenase/arogenate dehydrogenase family protein [Methanomicrobiales archaeon]
MQVCIIGGTGRMGRLFSRVFDCAGWDVVPAGRTTKTRKEECIGESEIVMISVPIRETVVVIREIAPLLGSDQLLCDLTSLKTEPVRAMLESKAQVLGLHPMFGPTVESLKGQTIAATPARCAGDLCNRLLRVFTDQGARITFATPEEHDRMMAVVQVLTHAATLSLAESMRLFGTDLSRARNFMSPVYRLELGLIGRLLGQDPALYCDIMRMNPHGRNAIETFRRAAERLEEAVKSEESGRFMRLFGENAEVFSEFVPEASKETDRIIRFMVEYEDCDTWA